VPVVETAVQISAGAAHTCALQANGGVFCWGNNESGQLGRNHRNSGDTPSDVLDLGGTAVRVEVGDRHSCAVMGFDESVVHCWGANDEGQLGDGSTTDRLLPVRVQGLPGPVRALAAGARATCAVTQAGAVYCWGAAYPLLAFPDGSRTARAYPGFESGWVGIDAGTFHFCALRDDGAVKCFGDGSDGQFGNGPIDGSLGTEFAADLAPGVTQIAAGGHHTCARNAAGGLQCWGLNTKGQLGTGSITRRLVPTQVAGLESNQANVAAGNFHSCALSATGGVKCWGANHQNTVGDGTQNVRLTPVGVVGLDGGVRALATGGDHSCVITAARRVQCWGANYDGRLGNGGNVNSAVPVDVQGLGDVDVLALALGASHACALLQGGAVKCWGSNELGQLGDGSTTTRPLPVDVSGLSSGVTAIAAGYMHTCAIAAAGALKCWGANNTGQLGVGDTAAHRVPTDVVGLASGVQGLGLSEQHSCALLAGGAVKCWGASFFGLLLGDASQSDRLVPGDVPSLRSGVTAIAGGSYSTCVVAGGGLQCWGAYPVGDNTELSRALPTPVAGMESGVTAVDGGFGAQWCAVVDGAAKCWGSNGFAQIGDGTTHGVPLPQTVRVDEPARRVGALEPQANEAATAARSDASGRYVVFQSRASNLVAGDSGLTLDVFRSDRQTGEIVRVSLDDAEVPIAADSSEPAVSADGNLVVFVAPDAAVGKARHRTPEQAKGGAMGVYLRNLVTGTTTRMSSGLNGGSGTQPRLAPNGNAVVFTSDKTPAGVGTRPNVYVVPIGGNGAPGTPRCVSCKSVDTDGSEGADADGESRNGVLSADGALVAFETTAKNGLIGGPSPCGGGADIMLRDLLSGAMQRLSPPPATPAGACGDAGSTNPSIDYAGEIVAFQSDQALDADDDNGHVDVYVARVGGDLAWVSAAPDGTPGNGASRRPDIAGDGQSLVFESEAANLDLSFADNNDHADIHVADLATLEVARLSRGANGAEADAGSDRPALNYDGTKLAFDSAARTLAGLVNGQSNVYQRSNPLASPVRSATWWKSSETGWGLTVFDQGSVLAPAWFTYDSDGEPTWFLTAGAFAQPDGSWRGDLLRLTGTPFDRIEGPAVQSATNVGNATLRFQGDQALEFGYTVDGVTEHKTLAPFPYGARTFACTASPTAARDGASNYSDLWTGAGGNAGWGLTVFHVDDNLFAGWYTYDSDGEAVFFVLATGRQADGSFRGPIFRQRNGVPFSQIDEAPSSTGTDQIGEATLRFSDGDSGTFAYTLGNVSQSKAIVRLLVGSRPSVCQATDARP
jgi:alpha-tubulin suppressor-like RCC1 family protein/Tol biopolymer transport system component